MTSSLAQDRIDVLETCRNAPQFVPVIHHGLLMAIGYRSLDTITPGPDITVEDYVVGLELLDHNFWLVSRSDGSIACQHSIPIRSVVEWPKGWAARMQHIMNAWDAGRNSEIVAYLLKRGDAPCGPTPANRDDRGAPDHAA